jgi:predicted ATP-dependent endonuclease of OLD family
MDLIYPGAMFESLSVANLRGIQSASLEGLTNFNIFIGRNGQGKSTVLEAGYILAAAPQADALVQVVRRSRKTSPASPARNRRKPSIPDLVVWSRRGWNL